MRGACSLHMRRTSAPRIERLHVSSPHCIRLLWLLCACACLAPTLASAQGCGSLDNGFGPFDYRKSPGSLRQMVELYHFNSDVQNLRAGQNGYLGGDLSYTLRAFPNHPRALYLMMKLGKRDGTDRPEGSDYTVGCFFERAVAFTPDDATVRILYGLFLADRKRKTDATEQLETARALVQKDELLATDANLVYNLGLGFYEVGRYPEATEYAKQAAALGFPLDGLQRMLKKAGKWQ